MGPLVYRLVRRDGNPSAGTRTCPVRVAPAACSTSAPRKREAEAVWASSRSTPGRQGSAALAGRLEPHLEGPLRRRLAVIGFARQPVIHVRDPRSTPCSPRAPRCSLTSTASGT